MSYVATPSRGVETCDISDSALISNHDHFWDYLASHAGVFRGARFSFPAPVWGGMKNELPKKRLRVRLGITQLDFSSVFKLS